MESEDEEWVNPVEDNTNKTWKTAVCLHDNIILHIDIDCFYAQVEMLRNPALKTKPLGIQQKYIIVTCNYVARERGLTKLMTVKDAKEKCPDLVLVSGEDLTNYRQMSYKISNYLQKYCPLVERLGFDENFLDITQLVADKMNNACFVCPEHVSGHIFSGSGQKSDVCGCEQRLLVGSHIAAEIRTGLFTELGITSCGGIAHNKLLSKLVAGTHKPNQQTTLFPRDVDNLMNQLKSVRSIQGIGHATSKRLKELGIVTVSDLQNADSSVLETEFGRSSMEKMKKLSRGEDDSSVVAFGLPQTLSDEDSFKKCSNFLEAKYKMGQLIKSLLNRLLEDGRKPHTLRLTLRKNSETSLYHRESRQCSIPASAFNRFSADHMCHTQKQLEDLAGNLFTKMINIKQPFHLTLINIAFAKLEQKTACDITSFMSPVKTANNSCCDASQTEPNQASLPTESVRCAEDVKSEMQDSSLDDLVEPSPSYPDSIIHIERNSIDTNQTVQKRLNNSPTTRTNSKVSVANPTSISFFQRKMSSKRSLNATPEKISKRIKENEGSVEKCLIRSLSLSKQTANFHDNSDEVCVHDGKVETVQADIDMNVLKQLPTEVQNEILASSRTLHSVINQEPGHSSRNVFLCDSNRSQSPDMCKPQSIANNKSFTKSKLQNDLTGLNNCRVFPSTSKLKNENVHEDTTMFKITTSTNDNVNLNSIDNLKDSCTGFQRFPVDIPPNVDYSVFINLPLDIQNELISEWKEKQKSENGHNKKKSEQVHKPGHTQEKVKTEQRGIYFKNPKPSPSNNIMSYFSKKS